MKEGFHFLQKNKKKLIGTNYQTINSESKIFLTNIYYDIFSTVKLRKKLNFLFLSNIQTEKNLGKPRFYGKFKFWRMCVKIVQKKKKPSSQVPIQGEKDSVAVCLCDFKETTINLLICPNHLTISQWFYRKE